MRLAISTAISRAPAEAPVSSAAAVPSAPASPAAVAARIDELSAKDETWMHFPAKDGRLLHLLVKIARARRVLELGTSFGYGSIWLASALGETGGRLITLELRAERVERARQNAKQVGVADRIEFRQGNAHALVPALDGPFDFVFLNADKDGSPDYFQKLHPQKLAPGALLVVNSAIHMRDPLSEYLELIQARTDYVTAIVSATMDDAMIVSARKRS